MKPAASADLYFRNEKVTAPLKLSRGQTDNPAPFLISVTKKLRPHWSYLHSYLIYFWRHISVTKKLRPHWSYFSSFPRLVVLWISVTKKLRPHWSVHEQGRDFALETDFRNEKVTAPLKLSFLVAFAVSFLYFRNEKVTAPLKRYPEKGYDLSGHVRFP